MKKIRLSAFESNSSSSHSISISENSNGIYSTIEPDEDGNIVVNSGEFGWEWERYSEPETKLCYAAMTVKDNLALLTMLEDVVIEHTGAKKIIFNNLEGGYIDHQSESVGYEAFHSKETLKNFLFNNESILYTGNDNDGAPYGFYDRNVNYEYQIITKPNDLIKESLNINLSSIDDVEVALMCLLDSHIKYLIDKQISYNYEIFNSLTEKDNYVSTPIKHYITSKYLSNSYGLYKIFDDEKVKFKYKDQILNNNDCVVSQTIPKSYVRIFEINENELRNVDNIKYSFTKVTNKKIVVENYFDVEFEIVKKKEM